LSKNARLIAERYAQALSAALPGDADLARSRDDLARLADLVSRSAELRAAIASPVVAIENKLNVLKALAAKLPAHPATLRFLDVLARHERLGVLEEIAAAVGRASDRRAGVVEVEIRSASPLPVEVRDRLAMTLTKVAGSEVRTLEVVDPELLGGLVVKFGGTVFDGSLKKKLEDLRSKMSGGMVGALA
jgi:F-type H+-transporting ATPase subunit delta